MEQQSRRSKTNSKNFCSVFKPFLHSKSKKFENVPFNLDIEVVIERDQRKIAEHFAKYFSSVANDIGDTRLLGLSKDQVYHHKSVHTITQSYNRRSSGDYSQFNFHMFQAKEIAAAFSNLDFTKSTGHDLISPKILKIANRELFHPQADWSRKWKKGDWVPVFKKGNKQDIKNYRPFTV